MLDYLEKVYVQFRMKVQVYFSSFHIEVMAIISEVAFPFFLFTGKTGLRFAMMIYQE